MICSKCRTDKPIDQFYRSKAEKSGYANQCKTCKNAYSAGYRKKTRARAVELTRQWRKRHPERWKDMVFKYNYGMPFGTYEAMIEQQGGKCAICEATAGNKFRERLHVDHCHDTKVVRGLLCGNCNIGLGNLKHDQEILKKAIKYLSNYPNLITEVSD